VLRERRAVSIFGRCVVARFAQVPSLRAPTTVRGVSTVCTNGVPFTTDVTLVAISSALRANIGYTAMW